MRLFARFLTQLIAVALVVTAFGVAAGPVHAQERRQGLFQFLFGGGNVERRQEPRATQPRVRTQPRRRTQRAAAPAQPPKPTVEKAEDARTVLVVGDFMAGGLAEGLREAFAERADVVVVDRANGSSGFVRDDFYDWPAEIGAIVDETEPDVVVAMIGSNDRQQMALDTGRAEKLTPEWTEEYERRVEAFAETIGEKGLPLVWVGQPSFRFSSMSADMLTFNDIYRAAAESVGGEFVDIWDGFVDENGAFVASGPDISGQTVRLRGSDGINLTRAGKRKVAFYAEKPLARFLRDGGAPAAGVAARASEQYGPIAPDIGQIVRTVPISLAAPAFEGETELLGAEPPKREGDPTLPGERLSVLGEAPPPRAGRADDFYGKPAPDAEGNETSDPEKAGEESDAAASGGPGTDRESTTAIRP
ncbi:MAG: DUF459 domain-containing protein [Rhizobiaceae bacterium]|nr:DUF459 domain-containing protein [Rhizobiaceae bacterium]MCV0406933.1 DUF459 domain-containing protein [Rhizobiaceae bacterium]